MHPSTPPKPRSQAIIWRGTSISLARRAAATAKKRREQARAELKRQGVDHSTVDEALEGIVDASASTRANVSQTKVRRQKRVKWSQKEVLALRAGVQKYGEGRWAVILREYAANFNPVRISVDLKDKWRNMYKADLVSSERLLLASKRAKQHLQLPSPPVMAAASATAQVPSQTSSLLNIVSSVTSVNSMPVEEVETAIQIQHHMQIDHHPVPDNLQLVLEQPTLPLTLQSHDNRQLLQHPLPPPQSHPESQHFSMPVHHPHTVAERPPPPQSFHAAHVHRRTQHQGVPVSSQIEVDVIPLHASQADLQPQMHTEQTMHTNVQMNMHPHHDTNRVVSQHQMNDMAAHSQLVPEGTVGSEMAAQHVMTGQATMGGHIVSEAQNMHGDPALEDELPLHSHGEGELPSSQEPFSSQDSIPQPVEAAEHAQALQSHRVSRPEMGNEQIRRNALVEQSQTIESLSMGHEHVLNSAQSMVAPVFEEEVEQSKEYSVQPTHNPHGNVLVTVSDSHSGSLPLQVQSHAAALHSENLNADASVADSERYSKSTGEAGDSGELHGIDTFPHGHAQVRGDCTGDDERLEVEHSVKHDVSEQGHNFMEVLVQATEMQAQLQNAEGGAHLLYNEIEDVNRGEDAGDEKGSTAV